MIQYTGFRYCPRCSSDDIFSPKENAMECRKCRYLYFHNTASAVGAILTFNGKIIFLRRADEPMKGMLDAPGGFVDYNESAEEALKREIKEETGIDTGRLNYLGTASNVYVYKNVTYFTSDIFYTAEITSIEKINLCNEVTEMVLLKPNEINMDELAFPSLRKMVQKFIDRDKK